MKTETSAGMDGEAQTESITESFNRRFCIHLSIRGSNILPIVILWTIIYNIEKILYIFYTYFIFCILHLVVVAQTFLFNRSGLPCFLDSVLSVLIFVSPWLSYICMVLLNCKLLCKFVFLKVQLKTGVPVGNCFTR